MANNKESNSVHNTSPVVAHGEEDANPTTFNTEDPQKKIFQINEQRSGGEKNHNMLEDIQHAQGMDSIDKMEKNT